MAAAMTAGFPAPPATLSSHANRVSRMSRRNEQLETTIAVASSVAHDYVDAHRSKRSSTSTTHSSAHSSMSGQYPPATHRTPTAPSQSPTHDHPFSPTTNSAYSHDPRLAKLERVKRRLGDDVPVDLVLPPTSANGKPRKIKPTMTYRPSPVEQGPRPPWMFNVSADAGQTVVQGTIATATGDRMPLLKTPSRERRRRGEPEKVLGENVNMMAFGGRGF